MKKVLLAAVLTICAAALASAQTTFAQTSASDDYHKVEFFAGYSHSRVDIEDSVGFNGFDASITGNLSRYVGLKFDLSGHYKSESGASASLHNFLGGVQLKDNSKQTRFKPFAHALVGAARAKFSFDETGDDFSDTGWAGAFGGGFDIRVSPRVDVRAVQLDYNPTRFEGSTTHNIRIGVGIVFH